MAYWLMKTEPGEFSFDDLLRKGWTHWDGVRNHQAKNNLAKMQVGDSVLIYHSVTEKSVVGVAQVSKTAYPDPTEPKGTPWLAVEVKPIRKLSKPVSLDQIKATPSLAEIPLIRQSRLSVMPLDKKVFDSILKLSS